VLAAVVAALIAAQPEKAMHQGSAGAVGAEFILDEVRQLRAGAGFDRRDGAGGVLLCQPVQRDPFVQWRSP
jgi:hypothetical protein